jgi:hypothetical protein
MTRRNCLEFKVPRTLEASLARKPIKRHVRLECAMTAALGIAQGLVTRTLDREATLPPGKARGSSEHSPGSHG